MPTKYLALDVGRARIGVALANDIARIASPLPAIANDDTVLTHLQALIDEHQVAQLVIGWPRGLNGQETEQTKYVDQFITNLEAYIKIPTVRQDEAVTSVRAEAELKQRGGSFEKGEVDSLSAVYILEDFLTEGVH